MVLHIVITGIFFKKNTHTHKKQKYLLKIQYNQALKSFPTPMQAHRNYLDQLVK